MMKCLKACLLSAALLIGGSASATEVMTAVTSHPGNSTYVLGETVQLNYTITGMSPSTTEPLTVTLVDETGATITTLTASVTSDSSGNASASVTAPSTSYGYFQANSSLSDGTTLSALGTRPAGFITYAVVVDPALRGNYGDQLSRFGVQGGYNTATSTMPLLGVRYMYGGASWSAMEPSCSGQFEYRLAQGVLNGVPLSGTVPGPSENQVYSNGIWQNYDYSIVTLAALPVWALLPGTGGTTNMDMGALSTVGIPGSYCPGGVVSPTITETGVAGLPVFAEAQAANFATVHAEQLSHFYQVTWEPEYSGEYGGTPAQLVQIFQQSYAAIHQGDPLALVAGPTLFMDTTSSTQLTALLAAGLGNYIDAFSIHPYASFPPETGGLPGQVLADQAWGLRHQLQAVRTAAGRNVPFIGTEHGYGSIAYGKLKEAEGDTRSSIIMLGEGATFDVGFYIADTENVTGYGYYWNLDPVLSTTAQNMSPKPVVPAYSAMSYFLDGTTTNGELTGLSGTQIGYSFSRGTTTITAIWDYSTTSTANVSVSANQVQVCTMMGNCTPTTPSAGLVSVSLSATPTYVIDAPIVNATVPPKPFYAGDIAGIVLDNETGGALAAQNDTFGQAFADGAIPAGYTIGARVIAGSGQTVSGITLNFVPQGQYLSGSSTVGGTLYFTGGCTKGQQIGSLTATVSNGGTYWGGWAISGANASSFAVTGSNPASLTCNTTIAAGSYSFSVSAGVNGYSRAITAYAGNVRYLSPTGNDGNACTSGSPCLSLNHATNCGDFWIGAASNSYDGHNFQGAWGGAGTNKWATVTCAGGDGVALVKCATFSACKFSTFGPQGAMEIAASYWAINGFECDHSTVQACFLADPPTNVSPIHHIAIMNTIANGTGSSTQLSGIQYNVYGGNLSSIGVDYTATIANLDYNATPGTSECGSGMSLVGNYNLDTNPGTHQYVALNVGWANVNGAGCAGGGHTSDGEGLIVDSPGLGNYTGQIVDEGNLFVGNGGAGIEVFPNANTSSAYVLPVITRHNTLYANTVDPNRSSPLWDLYIQGYSGNTTYLGDAIENNLIDESNAAVTAIGQSNTAPAISTIDLNWIYAAGGSTLWQINYFTGFNCAVGSAVPTPPVPDPGNQTCAGNVLGTSPAFATGTISGAPSCTGASDALACMKTMIAGFKPNAMGATNYGAVTPSGTLGNITCDANNSTDWIKNVERTLPADEDPCG